MGLFMDADGIPLAFDLFPGNQNEQVTLKPLETKVIRDFECSDFIFCSDAGLGSKNNRFFNSFGNRSYVITYSLKKMKKEERDIDVILSEWFSDYYMQKRLSGESRKSFCECSFSIFIHRFHHLKKCFSQNRMKNDLQNPEPYQEPL